MCFLKIINMFIAQQLPWLERGSFFVVCFFSRSFKIFILQGNFKLTPYPTREFQIYVEHHRAMTRGQKNREEKKNPPRSTGKEGSCWLRDEINWTGKK